MSFQKLLYTFDIASKHKNSLYKGSKTFVQRLRNSRCVALTWFTNSISKLKLTIGIPLTLQTLAQYFYLAVLCVAEEGYLRFKSYYALMATHINPNLKEADCYKNKNRN
jgi:hypothetical protein